MVVALLIDLPLTDCSYKEARPLYSPAISLDNLGTVLTFTRQTAFNVHHFSPSLPPSNVQRYIYIPSLAPSSCVESLPNSFSAVRKC